MTERVHSLFWLAVCLVFMFYFNWLHEASVLALILCIWVAQLPDIDLAGTKISRNIFFRFPAYFLQKFVIHRGATHSLLGTAIFAVIASPFIVIFNLHSWYLLILAYFSHIFIDMFNRKGCMLFWIPWLNSQKKGVLYSWYDLIPNLIWLFIHIIANIFHFIWTMMGKRSAKPERKKFHFKIGIATGETGETVLVFVPFFILFLLMIGLNWQGIIDKIPNGSIFLSNHIIVSSIVFIYIFFTSNPLLPPDGTLFKSISGIFKGEGFDLMGFKKSLDPAPFSKILLTLLFVVSLFFYQNYFASFKTVYNYSWSIISGEKTITEMKDDFFGNVSDLYWEAFKETKEEAESNNILEEINKLNPFKKETDEI